MDNLAKKTSNSLKWSAIERIATQFIQLVVMLILGRMLGPQAFGLIGMLAIFIAISNTFIDGGFSSAIIRKEDRCEEDFYTTFYFNILVSLCCYLILFFLSPYIASFYKHHELIDLTRVLGLTVLINAFAIVQRTRLTILMDFKTQAKASFISVLLSAFIAIIFAYYNFGVWSLVAQSCSFALFNTILLNIFFPWFPKLIFSKKSFKNLFGFGSKLLFSGLLDTIYNNIYLIIIGRVFNSVEVGYFSQAKTLISVPAMTLTAVIQRVTYPMLSQIQNDKEALEKAFLLSLKLSSLFIFPVIIGVGLIAKPFIVLILGDKWLPSAYLISTLSIGLMLYPIHAINLNLLQVKGRSDLFLKLEVIKKVLITAVLIITIPIGIKAICIGMVFQSYVALIINTYYTGRLSSLNTIKQIKELFPIWIFVFISSAISYCWCYFFSNEIIQILITLITALFIYGTLIFFFQRDLVFFVINSIRNNRE